MAAVSLMALARHCTYWAQPVPVTGAPVPPEPLPVDPEPDDPDPDDPDPEIQRSAHEAYAELVKRATDRDPDARELAGLVAFYDDQVELTVDEADPGAQ